MRTAVAHPATHLDKEPPVVTRRRVIDRRTQVVAVLVGVLGLLFVGLAVTLRTVGDTSLDLVVTRTVQQIDDPTFAALMVAVSVPGYAPWTWVLLWLAALSLLLLGFWRETLLVLTTEGAGMLVASIKLLVERHRPTPEAVRVATALSDFSYPSGHVVGYVALFGFLWFVVYVRFVRSWWRTVALVGLGLPIALVGVSRIYLGHHWASDVLGGYALGTAYLLALIEIYRVIWLRRTWANESPRQDTEG